jgi:uncharacterized protein DUF2188
MAQANRRTVTPKAGGGWTVEGAGPGLLPTTYKTQDEAKPRRARSFSIRRDERARG